MRTLAFLLVLACGGKQSAKSQHGDEHHGAMPPELTKFHDVLAPRWHAEHGPDRIKSTCDALPDFRARADALAKVVPPRGANADEWTTGTKNLVNAVAALGERCAEGDAAAFETTFELVHESFEALAKSTMHDEDDAMHHEHESGW